MTVHLPKDVEDSIAEAVQSGRFKSVAEALAEAWRSFQHQSVVSKPSPGLGSIGAMRDSADELDAIVADAMKRRREETWRELGLE